MGSIPIGSTKNVRSEMTGRFLLLESCAIIHLNMTSTVKSIECEVRALVDVAQYEKLKGFFMNVATFVGEGHQETRYFEGTHDLRIQKNDSYAKVWLKKEATFGADREVVEIRVEPERFSDLERLFDALEYKTAVIWLRHRLKFEWDGVAVALDHTKGYGYVVEMKLAGDEACRVETLDKLRAKMSLLGLKPTPKPILHERFSFYREHWKELIADEMKTPA